MIATGSYQHTKKSDHSADSSYVGIAKILAPGPIFTLEQLAANGHSATVASVVLPWLPAFLAHKGLSVAKSAGSGQPTFDSFAHQISGYTTTNEALSELLECVVEVVGLELLLICTGYEGGDALPADIASNVILAAYVGILREIHPSNPLLFAEFQKVRIPILTGLLGQMCPKYAPVALKQFQKEMDGLGNTGMPSPTQKLFLCDTLSCISMDFADMSTLTEFSKFLSFVTTQLSNSVQTIKKTNDLPTQFAIQYIKLLDEVFRGGNFEESGITNCNTAEEKSLMTKIEALFGDINLKWSPAGKPHPQLASALNLLLSTMLVRSSLNCYGANLEILLTKRLLPLVYAPATRDNGLHCVLRVLRGPRFAEAPPMVRLNCPRVPFKGSVVPKFNRGVRVVLHRYACIMPEFKEYQAALFRPDSLVWIQMALFDKKVMKKVKGMCSVANQCAEIMLTISSNSLSPSFIRGILDYKTHQFLDFFAVGVRTVRIVLDPTTGFAEKAATTRCNKLLDAMSGIQLELSRLLSNAIPDVLPILLHSVGTSVIGYASRPTRSFSILDAGDAVDVFRASQLKDDINDKLQILQEIANALPFVDFRLAAGVIKADLIHHAYDHISMGCIKSLQRLLKYNPRQRPQLIEELVMSLASTSMDNITRVTTMCQVVLDMLTLWGNYIKFGSDGRPKSEAAQDANVVEGEGGGYPAWTARTESAALICLCHEEFAVRNLAMKILEAVYTIRSSQFSLVYSVEFAAMDVSERTSESQTHKNKTSFCVHEFLEREGPDIVQRALYRYMVDSASGIEDPFATAFATTAPPLNKVSQMSIVIWRFALPVIAHRVVKNAHPSVMEETRRQLYMHLTDGGVRQKTDSKHIKDPTLWTSQIELTLSLANNVANELGEHLEFAGASGGGKWVLGTYADPLEKLEQYLRTIWGLVEEYTEPEGAWLVRFEAAMRASSKDAVGPITRSLWDWYSTKKKDRHRAANVMIVVKLLRILSECDGFVDALVNSQSLVALYEKIVTHEEVLNSEFWTPATGCSNSETVLNIAILVDKVCTSILKANYSREADKFEVTSRWTVVERSKLYVWLRSSHTWPGDFFDPDIWGADELPRARSRVSLTKQEEQAVFRFASRAVGKMVQMGPVMSEKGSAQLCKELLMEAPPFHLSWFLAAGRAGSECLQWLLAYHTEELGLAYIKRANVGSREEMKVLFNAVADNLVPGYELMKPPQTSVRDDSTTYYKTVADWGIKHDLGSLMDRDVTFVDEAAVNVAKVFGETGFKCGDCTLMGEMDLLFSGLRALRDPNVVIRNRSFLVVRMCVLQLMDRAMDLGRDDEGAKIDVMSARKQDFAGVVEKFHQAFSAESSAALDEEALEIAATVADCLEAVGQLKDFFEAVFRSEDPRSEWGGYHWTAQVLGPFCGKIELTEAGSGGLSEYGEEFVNRLFELSCQIPVEYSNKCTFMWKPLMRLEEKVNDAAGQAHENVHAVVSFLLYVTAKSGDNMHVCQQIALSCYRAFPVQCASWFTFPLTFEMQYGEASKTYDDDDRALQATSVIILLAGLCKVNLKPILPFLPSIIAFCILKYPTATRFAEIGEERSKGVASVQFSTIPTLMFNLMSSLQPMALKGQREVGEEMMQRSNTLVSMLKAGKEHKHMVLDWGSIVASLAAPGSLVGSSGGFPAIPDIVVAKSFGAIDPRALMREIVYCMEDSNEGLKAKVGQEILNWALFCNDSYTTTLKAHVMYASLGTPAGIGTLHSLTKEIAFLVGSLEEVIDNGEMGIRSTAQFNVQNKCFAALASLWKLVCTMGDKVDVSSVSPSVVWISLVLLRSARSGYDLRFFEYGLALLGKILTMEDASAVRRNIASTMEGFSGNWEPGFEGLVPLLVPGLVSKNKLVGEESRRLLEMCLKGGAADGEELCKGGLKELYIVCALCPFLSENGGQPPTVDAVSVCTSVKGGCSEGLRGVLEKFLDGMEVNDMYGALAEWMVADGLLTKNAEVLSDIFKIARSFGSYECVASLMKLSARCLVAGKEDGEIVEGIMTIVEFGTSNSFNRLPTTDKNVYQASLEVVQAAATCYSCTGKGNFVELSNKVRAGSTMVKWSMDCSELLQGVGEIQASTEKVAGGQKPVPPPAPPKIKKEVSEGRAPPPPRPPPPPPSKEVAASLAIVRAGPPPPPPPPPPRPVSAGAEGVKEGGDVVPPPPPATTDSPKASPSFKPPPPAPKTPSPAKQMEAAPTERLKAMSIAAAAPVAVAAEEAAGNGGYVPANEHPDYMKIFKLLKLGVPESQLIKKLEAQGLDVAVLENDELLVSLKSGEVKKEKGGAGGDGGGVGEVKAGQGKKKPRPPPPKKKAPPPPPS
jgi:hypothetical protein